MAHYLDKLLVGRLIASFSENAEMRLPLVQSSGGLVQSPGQSVVDQGRLENLLDGLVDVQWGVGSRGGGGGSGSYFISFDVRHGDRCESRCP